MKRFKIMICIACSLLLTSCFSYKDINRLTFVTALVVDITDEEKPSLYLEVFKPYRSEQDAVGKGQRMVFHGVGENMYEALRIMDLTSSQQLNFTQNKAIIFTKKAAEKGIDHFIDILNRNQQFLLRQFMFVTNGDAAEFLDTQLKEEQFMGLYLADICLNRENFAKVFTMRIDKYLNQRLVGNEVVLIPIVEIEPKSFDNKLSLAGAAVIQNDKYKGSLEVGESREYNLMMNLADKGMLDIEYRDTGNVMAFEIFNSKTNTDLTYDGETIYLNKKVSMKLTFGETQKPLDLDSEVNLTSIKENVEKKLSEEMHKLFDKWKEKGIDIFEVKRTFERNYPNTKLDVDNIMEITKLDLKINVEIEGSTDVTSFVD